MAADTEVPQESDLRSDLSAAFEQAESAPPSPPETESTSPASDVTPEAAPAEETEEQTAARARDDKGRFAKASEPAPPTPAAEKAPATPSEPVTALKTAAVPPGGPVPPTAPQTGAEQAKAPQSWKPIAREKWASIPADIQQEVLRREKDVSIAMQESSEARQNYQRLREVVSPYEPMLRAQNTDPYTAINSLFQSVATLSSGAPGAKAAMIANLISHYGVDIEQIDAHLTGRQAPQGQPTVYQDPRVDQLLQQVEQAKYQREQSAMEQAKTGLADVEQLEFFMDVKDDMADILDIYAKKGVALSATEAYNKAIWANPQVSEVLTQRREAKSAANPNGSTQRSRAAASSVKAEPAALDVGGAQSDDIRSLLEAAMSRSAR